MTAEIIAQHRKRHRPEQSANRVAEREDAEAHPRGASDDAGNHAKDRDEARNDDRPGAVSLEERASCSLTTGVHANPATVPLEKGLTANRPDPVAASSTSDGADPRCRSDTGDFKVALRRECTGGEQHNLTGKGKSHPFQRDEHSHSRNAVRVNEVRYSQGVLAADGPDTSRLMNSFDARGMPAILLASLPPVQSDQRNCPCPHVESLFRDVGILTPNVQ